LRCWRGLTVISDGPRLLQVGSVTSALTSKSYMLSARNFYTPKSCAGDFDFITGTGSCQFGEKSEFAYGQVVDL